MIKGLPLSHANSPHTWSSLLSYTTITECSSKDSLVSHSEGMHVPFRVPGAILCNLKVPRSDPCGKDYGDYSPWVQSVLYPMGASCVAHLRLILRI